MRNICTWNALSRGVICRRGNKNWVCFFYTKMKMSRNVCVQMNCLITLTYLILRFFFSLRNTLIEQTDILKCLSDEADEISRSRRCLDLQGIKQDSHCQISMYNAILALYYNVYITIKGVWFAISKSYKSSYFLMTIKRLLISLNRHISQ